MCILFVSAELVALDLCPKLFSAEYLVEELMDLDHILHTYQLSSETVDPNTE